MKHSSDGLRTEKTLNQPGSASRVEISQKTEAPESTLSMNPSGEVQIAEINSCRSDKEKNEKLNQHISPAVTEDRNDGAFKDVEPSSEATQASKTAVFPRRCYESARKRCSII